MFDLIDDNLRTTIILTLAIAITIIAYLRYQFPRWNQTNILLTITDLEPASEYEITMRIRDANHISVHRLIGTSNTLRILSRNKLISHQDDAYTSLLGPTIQRRYAITETGRQYLKTHCHP